MINHKSHDNRLKIDYVTESMIKPQRSKVKIHFKGEGLVLQFTL